MKLVCRLEGKGGIYDDGDYWVSSDFLGENPERITKTDNPYYPLSAVTKYDAEPVDNQILKELADKFKKETS